MIKANKWLDEVQKHSSQGNWEELDLLNNRLKQDLVKSNNPKAMIDYYDNVLKQVSSQTEYQSVTSYDLGSFRLQLTAAFKQAVAHIKKDDGIKGVYCEYFFDGGDSCQLNLFLSRKDPDDDSEEWGAYFGEDGVIIGPDIHKIMSYDPDLTFSPIVETVAIEYIESVFIAEILEVISTLEITNLPVGFSKHDGTPVLLMSCPHCGH